MLRNVTNSARDMNATWESDLSEPIEAQKLPPKAEELSSKAEEWPPERRAKFEQRLEVYRRAWEDSRDPRSVVDAMWLTENLQQPIASWLKEAAAKFPVDMGFVNVMHIPASAGPRDTPQGHWGPFQFASYAIQMLHHPKGNVSGNISRSGLVEKVEKFLPTDPYFCETGLKVPSRRTILRALDEFLLLYPS